MDASTIDDFACCEQDNQNTNRNEICTASPSSEQLAIPEEKCRDETKADDPTFKPAQKEAKPFQIPTVIITAPPEDEKEEAVSLDDQTTQDISVSEHETKEKETELEPELDMEVSIEKEKSQDTSNGIDTTSDDDFEVICRCSSTPLPLNNESSNSSLKLIDDSSPIKKETGIKEVKQSETPDSDARDQPNCNLQTTEADETGSDSFNEDVKAQLETSGGYDTSPLSSITQPVPVYNVNGSTVTYVSGPATSTANFSGLAEEGGLPMQIQNGFPVNYANKADVSSQSGEPAALNYGQMQSVGAGAVSGQNVDPFNFVYPSIYVSNAGLISVLLRHDMSVEMTVDRTIRVVSHQHMMAVATDSRGTSACLYHPALKVIQQGTTTDITTDAVRVHMGHDDIAFAIGNNRYRFDAYDIQPATHVKFSDICKDQSVNLLFSSEGYGESLVPHCLEVASKAEYANLPKGGVIVRINGVKVTQTGGGDVTVVTGAKFIRLSPTFGMTRLGNRFIDIEIERDWSCRVSRGAHCFFAGDRRQIITNGKMEVDINEHGRFKVAHLNPHRPVVTPQHCLRQPDNYVRRVSSVTYTPSAARMAARTPPLRRRSAPVTR